MYCLCQWLGLLIFVFPVCIFHCVDAWCGSAGVVVVVGCCVCILLLLGTSSCLRLLFSSSIIFFLFLWGGIICPPPHTTSVVEQSELFRPKKRILLSFPERFLLFHTGRNAVSNYCGVALIFFCLFLLILDDLTITVSLSFNLIRYSRVLRILFFLIP